MNVPVTLAVQTGSYSTTWSGSLWSKGDSVFFSGSGSTRITRDLEICEIGSRLPGTQWLSGSLTVRSMNPYRSETLHLTAPFTLEKASTTATITSVRRSYGTTTVRGKVATQAGLPPGGYVRVQAKRPGRFQWWRTVTTKSVWYSTDVWTFGHRLPKRTKFRLVYEGDTLSYPSRSSIRSS